MSPEIAPQPFVACQHCGSTGFDELRTVGITREISCRGCGATYSVHVVCDKLYLIDEISPVPASAATWTRPEPGIAARPRGRLAQPELVHGDVPPAA